MDSLMRKSKYTFIDGMTGFSLNIAGMNFSDGDMDTMSGKFTAAYKEMNRIEAGEIKNPDDENPLE